MIQNRIWNGNHFHETFRGSVSISYMVSKILYMLNGIGHKILPTRPCTVSSVKKNLKLDFTLTLQWITKIKHKLWMIQASQTTRKHIITRRTSGSPRCTNLRKNSVHSIIIRNKPVYILSLRMIHCRPCISTSILLFDFVFGSETNFGLIKSHNLFYARNCILWKLNIFTVVIYYFTNNFTRLYLYLYLLTISYHSK